MSGIPAWVFVTCEVRHYACVLVACAGSKIQPIESCQIDPLEPKQLSVMLLLTQRYFLALRIANESGTILIHESMPHWLDKSR